MTRADLTALIDRMLVAETRTTQPPPGEKGDRLYGRPASPIPTSMAG